MSQFFSSAVVLLHGVVVHFPIALLLVSFGLDVTARHSIERRKAAWFSLLLGTLGTIPATVSGLMASLPYASSSKLPLIEQHQYLAFGTTALFGLLCVWRWRARRRGTDIGATIPYTAGALLAVIVLLLTVYNGHVLVLIHGIGVTPVTP